MNKEMNLLAATKQMKTLLSGITDEQISELTNELMPIDRSDTAGFYNRSIEIMKGSTERPGADL